MIVFLKTVLIQNDNVDVVDLRVMIVEKIDSYLP